jgi:demethylmenaquinone methyltransferase/2-methoxy-6-polyprenyl-1,4-benzoquinol methylase
VTSGEMPDLSKTPARIAGMFDAIAGRYDLLNHLLSAGIDRRWRRQAIAALHLTGRERMLDLCTGTGDLAIAAAEAHPAAAHVVGLDFAGAMLEVGRGKLARRGLSNRVALIRGDATMIPLADRSVDAIAMAFGIRNVEHAGRACDEMFRVLRPGGRLAILEFALPTAPALRALYGWYFNQVLPRIGRLVSGHDAAYGYLPASVTAFAPPEEFVTILRQRRFTAVSAVPLTLGVVFLYAADREPA